MKDIDFSYPRWKRFSELQNVRTFEISIDARHVRGNKINGIGLIFAGDGSNPSKRFGFNGNGSFYVGEYNESFDGNTDEAWFNNLVIKAEY